MQMIWLKRQPESYTFRARRSTRVLYWSQLTLRVMVVSSDWRRGAVRTLAERVMHENGLVALRSRRNHRDGDARERFDARQISPRSRRQCVEAFHAERILVPAGKLFEDGFAFSHRLRAGRQQCHPRSSDAIAGADSDRRQAVEDVELSDGQAVDAVQLEGSRQRRNVEPAATPRAAGDRPEFVAALGKTRADVVEELGRKRTGAHTRRVRLDDTENVVEHLRPD